LQLDFNSRNVHDEGTGSTWQALARRGLIKTRYVGHPLVRRAELLEVQLTPLGRRMMRTVEPGTTKRRRPPGTLTEWQWRCLVQIYAAMPEGISYEYGYQGIGDTTIRRLEEGQDGKLVQEVDPETGEAAAPWWSAKGRRALRLTERGRAYYLQHHAAYRERYPDVAAPAPNT
jgi:hypothetical protein